MIRSSILLPILLALVTIVAPAAPALAAPAKSTYQSELFTASSATLDSLADYLLRLGKRNFVPLSAPYETWDAEAGQMVWAISGRFVSNDWLAAATAAVRDQDPEFTSATIYGKTAVGFFEALTRAIDQGYLPLIVVREPVDGQGLYWMSIGIKLTSSSSS